MVGVIVLHQMGEFWCFSCCCGSIDGSLIGCQWGRFQVVFLQAVFKSLVQGFKDAISCWQFCYALHYFLVYLYLFVDLLVIMCWLDILMVSAFMIDLRFVLMLL